MTMCIRERVDVRPWSPALDRDIARVTEIWNEARRALRQRRAVPVAARSRSPTRSTRRSRFASAPTASRPAGAAGDYLRRAARASVPARMGGGGTARRPTIIDADEPRVIYRDKIAAAAPAIAATDDGGGRRELAGADPRGGRCRHRRCASAAAAPRISTARRSSATCSTRPRTRASSTTIRPSSSSPRAPARGSREVERTMRAAARCSPASRRTSAQRRRSAAPSRRACRDRAVRTPARCATSSSACACSTATARICAFGGRVMKNVAGFDVARLMTGALGTLGVLTEVSLKCLPLPKAETTRVFECSADEAIRMTNEWGGKPLPRLGDLPITRAGSRCACRAPRRRSTPPSRRSAATRCRRRSRRRVLAQRSRADASVFRRGARAGRAAVAAVGQVDGAARGSRRRAADRMGRRAALARRERAHRSRARPRSGRAAHGGHATLFRARRQGARRVPSAAARRCTRCTAG